MHQYNLQLVVQLFGQKFLRNPMRRTKAFLASLFHSLFSFLPSLHSFFALLSVLDWDCIPFQPFSKRLPSAFGLIFSAAWLYLCSYIAMHCKKYVWLYMCGCKYILLLFFSLCDKVISIEMVPVINANVVKWNSEKNKIEVDLILHNWMAATDWSVILYNLRHSKVYTVYIPNNDIQ